MSTSKFRRFLCSCVKKIPPLKQKTIRISVIGRPNAGKSSFINSCIGRRFLPISDVPHTTDKILTCAKTTGDTQMIFYDTPGLTNPLINRKATKMGEKIEMVENRLEHSNLIVLVADTIFARKYPFISPEIQNILSDYKKIPSVLVMSKFGKTRKKDNVIGLVNSLTRPPIKVPTYSGRIPLDSGGWDNFGAIFLVDSKIKVNSGLNSFLEFIKNMAPFSPWPYDTETFVVEGMETLLTEVAREALFHCARQEVPFIVKPKSEISYDENFKMIINFVFWCPNSRIIDILEIEKMAITHHIFEFLKMEMKGIDFKVVIGFNLM